MNSNTISSNQPKLDVQQAGLNSPSNPVSDTDRSTHSVSRRTLAQTEAAASPSSPSTPLCQGVTQIPSRSSFLRALPYDVQRLIVEKYVNVAEAYPLLFVCKYSNDLMSKLNKQPPNTSLTTQGPEKCQLDRIRAARLKLLEIAARQGRKNYVEWFVNYLRYPLDLGNIPAGALYDGTTTIFDRAAESGNVELLKYLKEMKCPWSEYTIAFAAGEGLRDAVNWLLENKCPYDEKACKYAASGGQLNILQYLWKEKGLPCQEGVCTAAAREGHLNILKYLHDNGCPWNSEASYEAARSGHVDILKYLHANGCPWDDEGDGNKPGEGDRAAFWGHLEVLQYLRTTDYPWNKEVIMRFAAEGGQLKVVQWLYENGHPLNEDTYAGAAGAASGAASLEVLKWLRAHACPKQEQACLGAAAQGNIEVLQWLRADGCIGNVGLMRLIASQFQKDHILIWLDSLEAKQTTD